MAASIVVIDLQQGPGVLIEVHVALGINVPLVGLQRAFHFPHTVQFVAGQVLVDVTGLDDVVVFDFR
ncbi:hypothetical protein D3C84_1166800 [compost metagenome]